MSSNLYDSGMFMNYLVSLLLSKVTVPGDFHTQVQAVKAMQMDDVTGLIDVLTDFSVNSATVDYTIDSDNEVFTKILNKWLSTVNIDYNGKIPSGITELSKEYLKERWKYSSFPILKIGGWSETEGGFLVPNKLFFVDGGSVYAKEKDEEQSKSLLGYDYYLTENFKDTYKLDKQVLFSRPYGRWFDKYPVPFLIKRGVYHNYKLIESLKNKQKEILDQVIPYLFLIKKGTEGLNIQKDESYTNDQLQAIIDQFQTLMDNLDPAKISEKLQKTAIRATNFDEEIKHLIPDLSTIFKPELFAVAEKNILSGLGFIDIAEGVTSSRRESILNPKAFIKETEDGVKGFKQILKDLILKIQQVNATNHRKYSNVNFKIYNSPITGFMTDKFKQIMRRLWSNGLISSKTATEVIAETDFETEVKRREQEAKNGIPSTMYPPISQNREGTGIDLPPDTVKEVDKDEKEIPEEKQDETERQEFEEAQEANDELEGSPYQTIKDLPAQVKNNMSIDLQRVFMRVFNNAYEQYQNDTRAFRVAWSVIRNIGRKDKKGIWIRKKKRVKGKLEKVKLNKSMLQKALEKEEKRLIDDVMKNQRLKIQEGQLKIIDKILNRKNNNDNS